MFCLTALVWCGIFAAMSANRDDIIHPEGAQDTAPSIAAMVERAIIERRRCLAARDIDGASAIERDLGKLNIVLTDMAEGTRWNAG